MPARSILCVTGLLLALGVGRAPAAWVVDGEGRCVEEWTPASLGRGPTAIVNVPALPVRSAAGGVRLARESRAPGPRWLLVPMLAIGGGGMGLVESGIWLVGGLADTVTGGYFAIAPEEATRLSVAPVVPAFATVPPEEIDPCGRRMATR